MSTTITYNGERFESINDAILKATVEGIKKIWVKKLDPFTSELSKLNSKIKIDIQGDLSNMKTRLTFDDNITDELKEKIKNAIH